MVVIFFGGIGMYYFKIFRWRQLEQPLYDLLIVKNHDNAELAFFRKKTNPDFVDPALQQLEALTQLRKDTKRGTVVPEEYEQSMKEIGNRLIAIMSAAKLRQIPSIYEKHYDDVLIGISEVYRSWRSLEEAMGTEIKADKEKAINESIEFSKKARNHLKGQREFFYVR
jgi:hypothetical protein